MDMSTGKNGREVYRLVRELAARRIVMEAKRAICCRSAVAMRPTSVFCNDVHHRDVHWLSALFACSGVDARCLWLPLFPLPVCVFGDWYPFS